MPLITSRANERIKAIRALRNKRERERAGVFFAESARLVAAAVGAGASIEAVLVVPERLRDQSERDVIAAARRAGAEIVEVSAEVYDSVSFRGDPDSMGAVIHQRRDTLPARPAGELSWVAVHEVQHPGNLGTLIRTSDAAGGAGVILTGASTDPYHPVAVRGSLGALFSQRVVQTTLSEFAAWVRAYGARVIGTSPSGDLDYREADYRPPVVVFSAGERAGLSPEQAALCEQVVRIPMLGAVDSLNLSVATALVLYEVARANGR
ncbi:MAG TPA: RNA methyltransferase [Dehalococcoidia bacterium]|nr:RNA methyltransferase [Dehalococcoidia bacterium]